VKARLLSYYVVPALLALNALLVTVNWDLRPERAVVWSAALILLTCMSAAWLMALRPSGGEPARRHAESVSRNVALAGTLVAGSLCLTLATGLGAVVDPDVARRAMMLVLGLVLMVIGNGLPKKLTPLAALRCDAAQTQAFHRLAGWTWVLAGLALAIAWAVLPADVAKPLSMVPLAAVLVVIVGHAVRVRLPAA